jgi:hypothetical protein
MGTPKGQAQRAYGQAVARAELRGGEPCGVPGCRGLGLVLGVIIARAEGKAGPGLPHHLLSHASRILCHAASLKIYERLPPRQRSGSGRAGALCRQGQ